ncbi:MAG TPA: hypothetical protein VE153_31170 [Myxococcus sp.]|nr:hypothetical protein [Myxococcus sp.]
MQVSHSTPRLLALPLLAVLCACGDGDKTLEGSVAPLLDLRYERAEALLAEGELSVSFVTPQGAGVDTKLKVSAQVADMLPEEVYTGPLTVDLAEVLEGGAQRGAIGRSVLDEPVRTFPQLRLGTLRVDAMPLEPGQRITGEFNVTFENGTDVYSGRTIFGSFEATVP